MTIVTDGGPYPNATRSPLLGGRRVRDPIKADITQAVKDIMAGKTRADEKTDRLGGRAIVRGDIGTATRTIGLLGGILSYAVEPGVIESNGKANGGRGGLIDLLCARSLRRSPIAACMAGNTSMVAGARRAVKKPEQLVRNSRLRSAVARFHQDRRGVARMECDGGAGSVSVGIDAARAEFIRKGESGQSLIDSEIGYWAIGKGSW